MIIFPILRQIYTREKGSGLYSVHSFYIANAIMQTLFNMIYPILLSVIVFYFLGFKDTSFENFYLFIKYSTLISTTGCLAGVMWSTFFESEFDSIVSSIILILMFTLGAGKFVNLQSNNTALRVFSFLSPFKQGTELFFRLILRGYEDHELFLTHFFGMKDGLAYCEQKLIMFCVLFLVIGWATMVYKARFI